MSFTNVVKVGGSLGRGMNLPGLCGEISRLGKKHPLLVVPGGGDFADQVRKADRCFKLKASAAHSMALLAMDQYGYVLNQLIADSLLTVDLDCARESAESGRSAILLPSAIVMKEDPLPHSWEVTSDSIAAWLAHRTCCRRLTLLKDVDGLMVSGRLVEEWTAARLMHHAGGVDGHLSSVLAASGIETWVINGQKPERLAELLETGVTTGTRIVPG
jgi:aspartokinase-like uncharacterized kinase